MLGVGLHAGGDGGFVSAGKPAKTVAAASARIERIDPRPIDSRWWPWRIELRPAGEM